MGPNVTLEIDTNEALECLALLHKWLLLIPPEREVSLAEAEVLLQIRAILARAEPKGESHAKHPEHIPNPEEDR